MAVEFEADDAPSFRLALNPPINAMREELGPRTKFQVHVWDERDKVWVGPHLPNGNHERWVNPLKSDAEANWLWQRLILSLNAYTADFRAFNSAYGDDEPTRH
jgi:hypothetical protein